MDNFLHTRVYTGVCKNIYKDEQLEHMSLIDSYLSACSDSKIQALGTCTIQLPRLTSYAASTATSSSDQTPS